MPNYEIKAKITVVGWNNVTANSEEEAVKFVEDQIDELFTFKAPLLNKYLEVSVEVDKGFEND